jgi:3-dehydroquinate synthase
MTLPVAEQYKIIIDPISDNHFSWLKDKQYAGWVVFVDSNTRELCLPLIQSFLEGEKVVVIEAPEGELNKHLGTCQQLWEQMFAGGVGRRWCAICLGGGVLEDMSGFVASTFKRGIDFLQIPTTLLSMVDSSVGGKLGVDFYQLKNSIGLFANPIAVWIDPVFLKTLSPREIRSGYAEIIKHGLIADRQQWDNLRQLTSLDGVDWQQIIPASVNVKREVVLEDPFEKGLRKALNFGHTIGHAIESYWLDTDDRLLHGEAIAAGMIMEAWLSTKLEALTEEGLAEVVDHILAIYGHQAIPETAFPELVRLMQQDKKNEDHRINFTLLAAPGKAVVNATAEADLIEAAMRWYNTLGQ